MRAGWVAGSVRARAMALRHSDPGRMRALAACGSLADALRELAGTPYGRGLATGQTLAGAQRHIAGVVLWELRVLAGWLPRDGVQLLRALAGWFEIANTDELLQSMAGRPAAEEFRLGALATAWPRLRQAPNLPALRSALAGSSWRDPGEDDATAVRLGMRTQWAARVAGYGEPARTWAAGAVALLLASELCAEHQPPDRADMHVLASLLGPLAAGATGLDGLAGGLPAHARWAVRGVRSPADLWQGEAAWWRRVERDGRKLLGAGLGTGTVTGAVAVMCADARRACAALEIAARGGGPLEAYDAMA